jgi:hypothetical protein
LAKVQLPEQVEEPFVSEVTQMSDYRNAVEIAQKAIAASARAAKAAPVPSVIEENHPDIAKAITLLWGYPEMNEYFDRMWLADGAQSPIDPEAMSELMLLARVHAAVTPERPKSSLASILGSDKLHDHTPRQQDVWADIPRRR